MLRQTVGRGRDSQKRKSLAPGQGREALLRYCTALPGGQGGTSRDVPGKREKLGAFLTPAIRE